MISYSHIVTTVSGETLCVVSLSYQSLPSLSSPEEVSSVVSDVIFRQFVFC